MLAFLYISNLRVGHALVFNVAYSLHTVFAHLKRANYTTLGPPEKAFFGFLKYFYFHPGLPVQSVQYFKPHPQNNFLNGPNSLSNLTTT